MAVTSAGERGFILGDVFLSLIDIEEPDWSSTFNEHLEMARETRHAVLDRLETDGSLVGAAHLLSPGLGRIIRADGRRYWQGVDLNS